MNCNMILMYDEARDLRMNKSSISIIIDGESVPSEHVMIDVVKTIKSIPGSSYDKIPYEPAISICVRRKLTDDEIANKYERNKYKYQYSCLE